MYVRKSCKSVRADLIKSVSLDEETMTIDVACNIQDSWVGNCGRDILAIMRRGDNQHFFSKIKREFVS